jgi:predicted CXXCH cytochrome family protein
MAILASRTLVRRTGLGALLCASALLLLAAAPVLADGGPHVKNDSSGVSTLAADGCAGCHRAHTAQGEMLLNAPGEEELCLTCHGAAGTGATTDVMTGIQYAIGAGGTGRGAALGALRGGGFDEARLASGTAARTFRTSPSTIWAKVSVTAPTSVTSAHLAMPANGLTLPNVAWGNDGWNTGVGASVEIGCASCHNPHGNGQYRILNPMPVPSSTTSGLFVAVASPGALVADAPLPPAGDARNYTVIQVKPAVGGTFMLLASDVLDAFKISDGNPATTPTKVWPAGTYNASAGDYWHVRVPWNSATGIADSPNDNASQPSTFPVQMEAWCSACHTRYHAEQGSPVNPSGDAIFSYRHQTTGTAAACTTCHVSHGSNAAMTGASSALFPYPDAAGGTAPIVSASSRLLKVDNRGTCQLCHDPTGTVTSGTYSGPPTVPGVP